MTQITVDHALQMAVEHYQAGRLGEAEQLYRRILAQNPEHAVALYLLGMVAARAGQLDAAVELIQRSVQVNPIDAMAHNNLGIAYQCKGQLDAAIAAYRDALRLNPDLAEAHSNMGNILQTRGRLVEAVAAYRHAIRVRPDYAEAHNNLANALQGQGLLDEAIASCRRAIEINPALPEAHNNLGNALKGKGQLEEAIASYRQAIALRPDYAEAHNNLGIALKGLNKRQEAIAAFTAALKIKPDYAGAHSNLGNVLQNMGRLDEAIESYRRAIALNPNLAESHNNLGNVWKDVARLDEAIAQYRLALQLKPGFADAYDNLAYVIHNHPAYDAAMISAEVARWNRQLAEPLAKFIQPHGNDRDPNRRLRIGYVSSDFHDHASAFFILPLLRGHDREQVEVTCYAQVAYPDAVTRQMQEQVHQWRRTVGMTDAQLAAQVREDKIDILIDLKLHTADNRLLVFAHKPAPVQATWLGYPGTTGLRMIDYRLTDPYLDPPGGDETVYAEKTIRLPQTFWVYDPLTGEPAVNAPPSIASGRITFGCQNNFCKVNDGVLSLWAKVLTAVPASRLLLLAPEGNSRRHVLDRLHESGIGSERVEFLSRQPRPQYLQTYQRIDIALDTFPYNGHTTSLDSFWMGVPVITLVGRTVVGRAGVSQLSNLGLTELIANDGEQFVQIAAKLAGDAPRLAELRRTLRERMQASPLMDGPRFARNMEAAYRQMWHAWCAADRV
jgi:protein O-GlcNAc transferase